MRLLLLLVITACLQQPVFSAGPEQRILPITISEAGRVTISGDSVDVNDVPVYVRDRLFKSSLGNRKYSKISISSLGQNVSIALLDQLREKVHEGQQLALNAICLEKFRTRFDDLDSKKQEKLKKQFPVLFQTVYY